MLFALIKLNCLLLSRSVLLSKIQVLKNCKPSSSALYQSKSPLCFSLLYVISVKMYLSIYVFIHFQMKHSTSQISVIQFHSQPPLSGISENYEKTLLLQNLLLSEIELPPPAFFLTAPTYRSGVKCCSPEFHYWRTFF